MPTRKHALAEPPRKLPTQTELLWECHLHARALCINGFRLNHIIGANPNWGNVADIMTPIAKATRWLFHKWRVKLNTLAMYDGLRPDAVFLGKCEEWPVEWGIRGYRSWHAAMFEQLVYDGSQGQLPVWLENSQTGAGGWTIAPSLDWNNPSFDSRTREAAWARIREMAQPVITPDGKIKRRIAPADPTWGTVDDRSDHDEAGKYFNFAGWWNLRNCDPWSQVPQLEAEYAYAARHLSTALAERWSPYLTVNEWIIVFGKENRNSASLQLKRWSADGKAEQPTPQGDEQPRGWRVLLSELTPQQRTKALDLEKKRMSRAQELTKNNLRKKPS
jgi:hypothetical protein